MRVAVVVLAMFATARADDDPPRRAPTRSISTAGEKSAAVGLSLSLGTTALGLGGIASGSAAGSLGGSLLFLVGPTTGHWYAHDAFNAGLGMRLAGTAVFLYGVANADIFSFGHSAEEEDDDLAEAAIIGGISIYTVGFLYELITVPSAVDTYNRRRRDVAIVPLAGETTGVALGGTF